MRVTRHHSCRVSPFGHPRIKARLTAPRGISQPPTSFIGSQCQGIHHAPLNTYKHKTNIRNCTSAHKAHHRPKPAVTPLRARCSQPLSTNQTPHPTTKRGDNNHTLAGATTPGSPRSGRRGHPGLLSQSPIVCPVIPRRPAPPHNRGAHPRSRHVCCAPEPHPTTGHGPSTESPESPNPRTMRAGPSLVVLLRKEVIQPHLPVRLPCYDFVPIADPTFDGSLPYGLGHRLRVLPTFMT